MPLVSVIMPNHNGERFIASAIDSVRQQTERDWELLVSDDASSDASPDLVRQLAEADPRIVLLRSAERQGPAASRNRAITRANGRYLAFLDSDDRWAPSKLEIQLAFQKARSCSLTFTAMKKMDLAGSIDPRVVLARRKVSYRQLLTRNYIPCSSAMIDRDKTGPVLMPHFYRRQDFALWLKILRETGEDAYGCAEPLLFYRVHAGSFSASKFVGARYHWRVLRDQENVPALTAVGCFAQYAVGAGLEYLWGTARLVLSNRLASTSELAGPSE